MNTDRHPASEVSDSELSELALNREPSSIRDIQYLYGGLYQLGVDTSNWPVESEYASYLTPGEAAAIVDEPNSLVLIDIRLEGGIVEPLGATVTTLDKWYLHRLAYAEYDAGQGLDHSITQKTGENSPEKFADIQIDRMLKNWSEMDGVKPALEATKDGWMLRLLSTAIDAEQIEELKEEVEARLDGEHRRLLSVRFTDHTEEEYQSLQGIPREDWRYPADIPAHGEAIIERQRDKWITKNDADSQGDGAGYVLGDTTEETFGMISDPFNLFTAKKRSWLPNLNRDQAANIHPITQEAAKYIERSEPFTNTAYQTARGGRLYHLPYFRGEQTPEKLRTLYALLWEAREASPLDDGTPVSTIEQFYRTASENPNVASRVVNDLAFWSIYITYAGTETRVRAMAEVRGTNALHHIDIADDAADVAGDLWDSNALWTSDKMTFANPDANHLRYVTSPVYFLDTTPAPAGDTENTDANSPAFTFYNQLMRGTTISQRQLLRAYLRKLDTKYKDNIEKGKRRPFPTWTITAQYAQLRTLDQSNTLATDLDTESTHHSIHTKMPETPPSSEQTIAEREEQAYREFIQDHELIKENPQRRAAFTFGALITTVANYQQSKNRSPLTGRLGPKTITKQNFKSYVVELLDLVNSYSAENNQVMRYQNLTGALADDLSHSTPSTWELTTEDIQWHISLGMAFGSTYHGAEDDDAEPDADTAGEP